MATAARAPSRTRVDRDRLECVHGEIAFARRTSDEKAPAISFPRYEDVPMVTYDVSIRNAHPIVDELSLDREGFTLLQHKVSCANERNPEILCQRYLEEMTPFIKEYFNASWVVPRRDGVIVRSADRNSALGLRGPGAMAHIDYAPIAAPMVAARESQKQGIPIQSYSRLMIIHAWRALSPPPQDFPLALCDSATALDTDIVVHDYTSDLGAAYKSCVLNYNPFEKWYYFPEMKADEVILFKGFDSYENCNARAPHSAFDDRRAHPDATPRESIEARFFVYFA